MKILHVVPSYLPAIRYGGPVFATHALCAALTRLGCEVTVFTTNADGSGESQVPVDTPVVMDGVTVWYFGSAWLRRLYYSPGMALGLRVHCSDINIVHAHSVFLWPTWAAARASLRFGVPYIISPRGMLVKDLIAMKSPWLKRAWISLIEQRNLTRAAGIHVTSAVEAKELRRFGFALPRVYEVPNGVATEVNVTGSIELPSQLAGVFERGRPVILCLGRINWKKGLDSLIPAMARLPEAVLLIVGNDEEGYTSKLTALAVREGVADRVIFAGPVYGPAKMALYRKAAVFALPSYSENFGNVVLEAMHEGCPVVVTPEVGASGIVEASGGGLVTIGEPAALAAAISRLLSDAALRADMGRKGMEVVRSQYSWDAVAEKMLEVYRDVIARAGERRV